MLNVRYVIPFDYSIKPALNLVRFLFVTSAGFVLSVVETNRVLCRLSKHGRVDEARQMFDRMPYRDEFAWNTLISSYASWGRFSEALDLFDRTPVKSSITWSSLISGYCKYGREAEAFGLFCKMQLAGFRPSEYTLGSIVSLCSEIGCLQKGEFIHGYAIKCRLNYSVFVATGLIDMYAKCYCMLEAERLFETVADTKHDSAWTALLSGYSHNWEHFKAFEVFLDMRFLGVEANQFTFLSLLTACAEVLRHDIGIQVHGYAIKSGCYPSILVQSALVNMYSKCHDLCGAKAILDSVENNDIISWNSMITGCSRQGFHDEAILIFKRMHAKDMNIDHYTYPPVLSSFAANEDEQNAASVHCLIIKSGFSSYTLVNNALVVMYAKQRKFGNALTVFDQITDKDVVSWTSLVTGYSHNGFYHEAAMIFCKMKAEGIDPDYMALASVLCACAELTTMESGRQVHAFIIRCGRGSSIRVANSLITMYSKCGNMDDARSIFDYIITKDVISWTALIVGYAQNGEGSQSLVLYDQMTESGTQPDLVTFIGLLFACSHARLVDKGRHYFESMRSVYRIEPGSEHYVCMIDLLCRSGKISEAKDLIAQMTVEPDATVWKSLLGACRIHGYVELGEMAALKLFELEPKNAVPYIMLANMYSNSGRWEDAARIRKLMKCSGVVKEPGCSWIEIDRRIHSFLCRDASHSKASAIYSKLDEIMASIKMAGYIPDMSFALHDVDEEGKELGLAYHSEKLAVALGLLALPELAPIRVFKNLRVCGDCHTAMKFISKVYARHIILRDANCFHHFREGKCSCGDYW